MISIFIELVWISWKLLTLRTGVDNDRHWHMHQTSTATIFKYRLNTHTHTNNAKNNEFIQMRAWKLAARINVLLIQTQQQQQNCYWYTVVNIAITSSVLFDHINCCHNAFIERPWVKFQNYTQYKFSMAAWLLFTFAYETGRAYAYFASVLMK